MCLFPVALIDQWKKKLGPYLIEYETLKVEEILAKGLRLYSPYLAYTYLHIFICIHEYVVVCLTSQSDIKTFATIKSFFGLYTHTYIHTYIIIL